MATDIVLKDRNGDPVTYTGIETVTFNVTEDGTEQATFTLGVEQTGKEVELALADGDQTVTVDDGYLLKELTIKKPDTLVPENIRYGENVGGVEGAFKGIDDRTDFTLNDNGEIVGATFYGNAFIAFPSCTTLEWVDCTNSTATSIGSYAFYQCSALTSIDIPDGVASIGNNAFWGCTSLASINIPDGVTSIGNNAFRDTAIASIDIPDSVTSIGNYAFWGCTSLASIDIPDSVTSIGSYAFYQCSALTSITIPDGVTSIATSAVYGCTALTNLTIGNAVTSIGAMAFQGCSKLTSVTIPANITSIGNQAFYQTGLTSATFEDTTTWYVGASAGATTTAVTVTNASTAATYLRSTYYSKYWTKV